MAVCLGVLAIALLANDPNSGRGSVWLSVAFVPLLFWCFIPVLAASLRDLREGANRYPSSAREIGFARGFAGAALGVVLVFAVILARYQLRG